MDKDTKTLFAAGSIFVGMWLIGELIKNGGKVEAYRCWRCNGMIRPGDKNCPWCGAQIDWRGKNL